MPDSSSWSTVSAPCRLEWRPSRWLAVAHLALGLLAVPAVAASELPLSAGLPLALAAWLTAVHGVARSCHAASHSIVVQPGGRASVDGWPVEGFDVEWRGPLAVARWRDRDDRWQRRCWLPDTLDACTRRELRLALAARPLPPDAASMAP